MTSRTSARLTGRVAIVTGSGRGIGRAIALRLAKDGCLVIVNDKNETQAQLVMNEIQQMGGQTMASSADIRSIEEVSAMVSAVLAEYGHVDILVNNAGVARPTPFDQIDDAEWDWVIDTNLKGAFNCCKAVLGAMKQQRKGVIINISSMAARSAGVIGGAHYTASKAGMIGLTRHLAKEGAPFGIRVNAVCPGATDTPLQYETGATPEQVEAKGRRIPLGRIGTPEDQANAVAFLASDEASFITGASLDVNGGAFMA